MKFRRSNSTWSVVPHTPLCLFDYRTSTFGTQQLKERSDSIMMNVSVEPLVRRVRKQVSRTALSQHDGSQAPGSTKLVCAFFRPDRPKAPVEGLAGLVTVLKSHPRSQASLQWPTNGEWKHAQVWPMFTVQTTAQDRKSNWTNNHDSGGSMWVDEVFLGHEDSWW